MDLPSVAPNSTPPRLVNSQLVSLPPVGILNLLCLICITFVCCAHLNIFKWNLRDINVYYYYYYYFRGDVLQFIFIQRMSSIYKKLKTWFWFQNCLILRVGDVALGGRKLSEEEGHYNDDRKPKGFDTKQIFVSPSVRYSGHDCYAKPKR